MTSAIAAARQARATMAADNAGIGKLLPVWRIHGLGRRTEKFRNCRSASRGAVQRLAGPTLGGGEFDGAGAVAFEQEADRAAAQHAYPVKNIERLGQVGEFTRQEAGKGIRWHEELCPERP